MRFLSGFFHGTLFGANGTEANHPNTEAKVTGLQGIGLRAWRLELTRGTARLSKLELMSFWY